MNHRVIPPVMLAEFMDLCMAVVTACNAVISTGGLNLFVFYFSEFEAFLLISGLKKSAAAAAAIIIGSVWLHIHEVFFSDNRFNNKSQIFGNGVTKGFPYNLTRILNGEFYPKIFIPVRINL